MSVSFELNHLLFRSLEFASLITKFPHFPIIIFLFGITISFLSILNFPTTGLQMKLPSPVM